MKKIKQILKKIFPILIKIKYAVRRIIKNNGLEYMELHVTDNCNLKCKACTHFSNVSKTNNFVDARILQIRLERLKYLFTIDTIRLLGGEPLLHPDIINVLKIARLSLPCSHIELVTNGLLLNKMSDDFFKTCQQNNIKIFISSYSVLKNKEELEKHLLLFNIKYEFSPMIFSFSANLNPKGNSEKKETFKRCVHTKCKILKEDKFYICPICAYIYKYNGYFNKNIPEGKGINIFTNSTKQILNYFNNAEETCKYCTNDTKYVDWRSSSNPQETDWNGNI